MIYLIMTHISDDIAETSNSGSKNVIEDCTISSENLASDGTANVLIEVTASDASLATENLSVESNSIKIFIEDNVDVSGYNKDVVGSNVAGAYSSTIEVYHSHVSK